MADRVHRLLAAVGLRDDVDAKLPAELSGGMRKRVGIARALVLAPELVLYDEPTAGLDPTNARLITELVESLKAEGASETALIVTHDLDFAQSVSDSDCRPDRRAHCPGRPARGHPRTRPCRRSRPSWRERRPDHGRAPTRRAGPRSSSGSGPSSWRASRCSSVSSTCWGGPRGCSSASTGWSRASARSAGSSRARRCGWQACRSAASARSGCPSPGRQGAGRCSRGAASRTGSGRIPWLGSRRSASSVTRSSTSPWEGRATACSRTARSSGPRSRSTPPAHPAGRGLLRNLVDLSGELCTGTLAAFRGARPGRTWRKRCGRSGASPPRSSADRGAPSPGLRPRSCGSALADAGETCAQVRGNRAPDRSGCWAIPGRPSRRRGGAGARRGPRGRGEGRTGCLREVEEGRGMLHALIYDEGRLLKDLEGVLARTGTLVAGRRAGRGRARRAPEGSRCRAGAAPRGDRGGRARAGGRPGADAGQRPPGAAGRPGAGDGSPGDRAELPRA